MSIFSVLKPTTEKSLGTPVNTPVAPAQAPVSGGGSIFSVLNLPRPKKVVEAPATTIFNNQKPFTVPYSQQKSYPTPPKEPDHTFLQKAGEILDGLKVMAFGGYTQKEKAMMGSANITPKVNANPTTITVNGKDIVLPQYVNPATLDKSKQPILSAPKPQIDTPEWNAWQEQKQQEAANLQAKIDAAKIRPEEYFIKAMTFGYAGDTNKAPAVTLSQKGMELTGSIIAYSSLLHYLGPIVGGVISKVPGGAKVAKTVENLAQKYPWKVGYPLSIAKSGAVGVTGGTLEKADSIQERAQNAVNGGLTFAAFDAIAYPVVSFFRPTFYSLGKVERIKVGAEAKNILPSGTKIDDLFTQPKEIWFRHPEDPTLLLKVTQSKIPGKAELNIVPTGKAGVDPKTLPLMTKTTAEAFKAEPSTYQKLTDFLTGGKKAELPVEAPQKGIFTVMNQDKAPVGEQKGGMTVPVEQKGDITQGFNISPELEAVANADWEANPNYGDKVGVLATKSGQLEQQLKEAKASEKPALQKQIDELQSQIGNIQDEFVAKWQGETQTPEPTKTTFTPADFSDNNLIVKPGDYIVDREGVLKQVTSGNDQWKPGDYNYDINAGSLRAKEVGASQDYLDYANQIRKATPEEIAQGLKNIPAQSQGPSEFVAELKKLGYTHEDAVALEQMVAEKEKQDAQVKPRKSGIPTRIENLNIKISKAMNKFRKEADLMASKEGAGVRYYKSDQSMGEEKLYSYFKLSRAKGDMKRQAQANKVYAHELLYENDAEYRKMVDQRDKLLEKNIETADNEIDVAKMFGEANQEELKLTQNVNEQTNNGAIQDGVSEKLRQIASPKSSQTKGVAETQPVAQSQEVKDITDKFGVKGLSPELQKLQEENIKFVAENEDSLIKKYVEAKGNYLNGDFIKDVLFDKYKEDKANYKAFTAGGNYLWNKILDKFIAENHDVGDGSAVMLTGGQGSGKSTSMEAVLGKDWEKLNGFIIENPAVNDETIQRIIDSGYPVVEYHIAALMKDAFERALLRAERTGRVFPVESLLAGHSKAKARGTDRVNSSKLGLDYVLIDNTGAKEDVHIIDDKNSQLALLSKLGYNEVEVGKNKTADEYRKVLAKKYEQGEITRKVYSGFTERPSNQGEVAQTQSGKGQEISGSPQTGDQGQRQDGVSTTQKENKPLSEAGGGFIVGQTIKFGAGNAKILDITKIGNELKYKLDVDGKEVWANGGLLTTENKKVDIKLPKQVEELGFKPKNLEDLEGGAFIKENSKLIKRSDIAAELSKKLGVPIRRGKFMSGGAIGIFKTQPEIVRIKKGGLATIFHEIGHFLDQQFEISVNINAVERKALMQEYGNTYAGQPKKQAQEAFAEFLRLIMTGQTEKAMQWAPEFYNEWGGIIGAMPEIKEVLDTATADFKRWKEMPATSKVLSQISIGEQKGAPLKERFSQGLHNLYTMALDDLHPLSEFSKVGEKNLGKISAEKDPYILARNLRGWVGKANTFLTKGTFGKDYWTEENGKIKANFKGKSFQEIMAPIEKAGQLDDFRVYIVAKRAMELAERKITTGIAKKDAEASVEELIKKHSGFEEKAQELYKYQDELLQYAADNGLTGPKGLERIKELNKMRVPFYRVMEEMEAGGYMGKKKFGGNMGSPIKKIKGSEREIIDPIESIIKDTYSIINVAERNNIGVAMANLAKEDKDLGRIFERVAKPMSPVKVNVGEVLSKVSGINLAENPEIISLIEELGEELVTIFKPMQDRGPNMLNVNMGDTQEVFQVEPDLFKAIQGLNAEDVGLIFRVLSMPSRMLRAGATLSPDFSVRNPIRDQFSALVYSKYGFKPGIDLAKGIFELFKKGDVYDLWRMGGGEHSMLVSLDRANLQQNYKELMRSTGANIIHHITHPIEALQMFSEITEQATRLGEMKRALQAGENPVQSAFASREVTLDFARVGTKTKAINSLIAFFNSNLQGQDKMIRAFKTRPFQTLIKVLLGITLPSILLYFANRKDPRWKEVPQWQKDLFWIVFTEKHIWRIPKPFELGILFGSVPERVLEFMDTKDPKLFTELESAIANGATPGFIPTFMAPIIENITNYSFFLNRPIVPQGTKDLPAEAQAGTYTSETAKILGKALNYSPAKIDNLIYGYTGGLGKYVTQGLDTIITGTGIKKPPVAPEGTLEDAPVIKAFMIRPPVGTSSESVNRIYDLYSKASGELSYVNKLVNEGRIDDAKEFIKNNPDVVYGKMLNALIAKFSDINQARDQIRNSKTMSAKGKAEKIKQLDELQTKAAQKALEMINNHAE
jgi:hypothetical protein